jgi:LPXTG-motif cell wall-anchored protein
MVITDEAVPLAKAPKTGDLSGIWAVISGLSLGGAALLNRKRKEEE